MDAAQLTSHILNIRDELAKEIPGSIRSEVLAQLGNDKAAARHLEKLSGGSDIEAMLKRIRKTKTLGPKDAKIPVELPAGISDEVLAEELSERGEVRKQMEHLAQCTSLSDMGMHMMMLSRMNPELYASAAPMAARYTRLVAGRAGLEASFVEAYDLVDRPPALKGKKNTPIDQIPIPEEVGRRAMVNTCLGFAPGTADDPLWVAMVELSRQPTLAQMRRFIDGSSAIKDSRMGMALAPYIIQNIETGLRKRLPKNFSRGASESRGG